MKTESEGSTEGGPVETEWPLWFVGMAFIHNRRFGMLFRAGLAIQLFADAYIL